MLRRLAPYLAYLYLSFVGLTTRLTVRGEDARLRLRAKNQRHVYVFWHERQAFLTYTNRDEPASVLVSLSRDGDIIARIMELSRMRAVRGSSSRGASLGLKALISEIEAGWDIGITPDGPKGPRRKIKPGAVQLAQKLGLPIIPMACALSRKIVFKKSWDQFQFPLPFGRASLRYGEPLAIGPADDPAIKAAELEDALNRVTEAADRDVRA